MIMLYFLVLQDQLITGVLVAVLLTPYGQQNASVLKRLMEATHNQQEAYNYSASLPSLPSPDGVADVIDGLLKEAPSGGGGGGNTGDSGTGGGDNPGSGGHGNGGGSAGGGSGDGDQNGDDTDQEGDDSFDSGDNGHSGDGENDENMTFSKDGVNLLKSIEELRVKPYDDQTGKQVSHWVEGATIGYGHLISRNEWYLYKNGLSGETQARRLLMNDLAPFVSAVNSTIAVSMTQQEFDALVIFAFNIGINGFQSSSVTKIINDSNADTPYSNLESAWKAWNKSQEKISAGLINCRNAEWDIYTLGVYEKW